jgi:hypothetical protein
MYSSNPNLKAEDSSSDDDVPVNDLIKKMNENKKVLIIYS